MIKLRKVLGVLALLLLILVGGFYLVAPAEVERTMNPVLHKSPYAASASAKALHATLLVADMHADTLLWGRDILARGTRGQVDVPRLIEGNVALQIFSLPTKTPRGLNYEHNDDKTDQIKLLAMAQGWPVRTWGSLTERALYQANRLNTAAEASEGRFTLIGSASALKKYLAEREKNPDMTAGLLAIEGAHALDGNLDNLDRLYDAGYRMVSPAHFFDNFIGGSSAGENKIGLTGAGREWVRRMEAKHMVIDLAHSSAQTIDDVLAITTRPVVVSHGGVKGTCNNNRNLSDEQVKAIAAKGGVIGIGYWETATCGHDAHAIARAARYVANLVGVEHVGLGSDFDGAVTTPFDASGMVQITDALLAEGFSNDDIARIMGGNVIALLQAELPE